MKLKPLCRETVLKEPRAGLLAGYLNALADLAHPKQASARAALPLLWRCRCMAASAKNYCDPPAIFHLSQALAILEDEPRLAAYETAISNAVMAASAANGGVPPCALVLGAGGGVLGLLSARSGVASVICVERSRMLYRMAKQALEANAGMQGIASVHLLDCGLQSVGIDGELPPADVLKQQAAGASTDTGTGSNNKAAKVTAPASDVGTQLPQRASLLITDLLDHSVLGMGLLPAIDYAAERLLAPGARVVPRRVQVRGRWGNGCCLLYSQGMPVLAVLSFHLLICPFFPLARFLLHCSSCALAKCRALTYQHSMPTAGFRTMNV